MLALNVLALAVEDADVLEEGDAGWLGGLGLSERRTDETKYGNHKDERTNDHGILRKRPG